MQDVSLPTVQLGMRPVGQQLKEAAEAVDLAKFVYRCDQRLGRADMAVEFDQLPPLAVSALQRRALMSIRYGDPVVRDAMEYHAKVGILQDITSRLERGALAAGTPEAQLGMSAAKRIAHAAVSAAIGALAGLRGES